MSGKIKIFKPTSWSIDNKTSVMVLTAILILFGASTYNRLPKESFPDIVVPTIYVSTVYAGNSPTEMESKVAKPIEKEIKSIPGVKKLTSNSLDSYCNVVVEFNTDVNPDKALDKVKEAIDKAKAKSDFPKNLTSGPNAAAIEFSEVPIMFLNVSGNYGDEKLKQYADLLKDRIESMKEITRVDIVGAPEREIQVNVDMYKLQSYQLTMGDIENAIAYENMNVPAGNMSMAGRREALIVKNEFRRTDELENLTVNAQSGAHVRLGDIATISDTTKEKETFARLNGKNVITLNIIKRSGENLIDASDKIRDIVTDMKKTTFPQNLDVVITGDQSERTRVTVHDLINTIIIGFMLVLLVLMFFMGGTNAFFVALSVPLSMCLAFLVLDWLGWTMNMIVLFSFLLALGIVVDDAIVVIENTHRIFTQARGKMSIVQAAKLAASEVFLPVLSGTATTLAPFVPLAFWKGIIGKFMMYLPVTLIITLTASLVVAYIMNPVFAVLFMKHDMPHEEGQPAPPKKTKWTRGLTISTIIFVFFALIFHVSGSHAMGNFSLFVLAILLLYRFVLDGWVKRFQEKAWPSFQNRYERFLRRCMKRPVLIVGLTVLLLIISPILMMMRQPKVEFFPQSDPNFTYVYVTMPLGTHQLLTDSVTNVIEKRVVQAIGKDSDIVSSVISNVALGVTDPQENDQNIYPHRSKITVAYEEFAKRHGKSTSEVQQRIRKAVADVVGPTEIVVNKEANGPPTGKPVNIEITSTSDNVKLLSAYADSVRNYLAAQNIPGVDKLKIDVISSMPEMWLLPDRPRVNREGIFSSQVGGLYRNAVFGKEVSRFKTETDDYPIMVRYNHAQRNNLEELQQSHLVYRDMSMGGQIRDVPLSSFAELKDTTSLAMIKRKNQRRVITVYSDLTEGFAPNEVIPNVQTALDEFIRVKKPPLQIKMTGQQEEQAETAGFLGRAMLISILLIILILVTQFNSLSKPLIILSEIFFSIIGVFLGIALFGMDVSIVMTGVGVIALAGIVVRNGILVVEFIDLLRSQGMEVREAIIQAGKTRMTPVLLTATATMLGLIPLAVGLNIDFAELFATGNPHIFFGGDSVAFWGPLSWTMIYGLAFATFLTLIVVPVMYWLFAVRLSGWIKRKLGVKTQEHTPEENAELPGNIDLV